MFSEHTVEYTRRAHTFVEHTHLMRENMVATWKAILAQLVVAAVLAVGLGMPSGLASSAAAQEASDTSSLSAASAVRDGRALTEQDQTAVRRKSVKQRLRSLGRDFRGHCRRAVEYMGRHFRRYDTAAHGGEPDQRSSNIDVYQTVADGDAAFDRARTQVWWLASARPRVDSQEALHILIRNGSLDGEVQTMEIGDAAQAVLEGGTGNDTTWSELDVAAHGGECDNVISPADARAFDREDMQCREGSGSRSS